jgi:hypothetical protein
VGHGSSERPLENKDLWNPISVEFAINSRMCFRAVKIHCCWRPFKTEKGQAGTQGRGSGE